MRRLNRNHILILVSLITIACIFFTHGELEHSSIPFEARENLSLPDRKSDVKPSAEYPLDPSYALQNLVLGQYEEDFPSDNKNDIFESITSISELNDTFIYENTIRRKPLVILSETDDISLILENIVKLPSDIESIIRERDLLEKIIETFDSRFASESYVCRGEICIIEFIYYGEFVEKEFESLNDFDKGHLFSTNLSLGNNENLYRGVFIAAENIEKIYISR